MTIQAMDTTRLAHDNKLFIGGRWVAPSSSEMVSIISPSTEEVVYQLPAVTQADAEDAVAAARAAFGPWSALSFADRRTVVTRFCSELKKRIDLIRDVWAVEAGMPVTVGETFNAGMAMILDDMVEISGTITMSEIRQTVAGPVQVRREPIGPTLAIVTYNGPHTEIALAVIPALMAGNTFVIKLPPESQMLGYVFADAADAAGFPPGVLSIFSADAEVSRYLVAHEEIDAVHFTGGTEIGAEIVQACAKRIARVTLELGGKSAAIVAEDADLDAALPHLIGAMTTYCGQICVAMTRIVVPRSRHDEIVDRLVAGLSTIRIGDPLSRETQYGPLAASRVRARAEGYIERAVAAGARIAFGGQRPDQLDRGWYLEPTLLVDVENGMEVAQNEIFGPVICVIPYDSIEDAIAIANDSRYGLSGSVFTTNPATAEFVSDKVRSGTFAINAAFPSMLAPFGGMKQSGLGSEGGREAFFELTNLKSIALPPQAD
ncbi:aldehyde dehydrogenase [Nocardioides endophyticus]|uniref:Aldehyde dehydrogenase n=1 Tax=Nocardioides endophyticus TaxID=1353775 RepID=A0ABP8YV37_9ACTN